MTNEKLTNNSENGSANHGKPRQAEYIQEGYWQVGAFDLLSYDFAGGLMLSGDDSAGNTATFFFAPGEVQALLDVLQSHESEILSSDFVDRPPNSSKVVIRKPDSGPTPIPTNTQVISRKD